MSILPDYIMQLKKVYLFRKDINFFNRNKKQYLLIAILTFCFFTIRRDHGSTEQERRMFISKYNRRYPLVIQKVRELRKFYNDIWDLMKRYSLDIIAGFYRFFERNPELKNYNYYIYSYFVNEINQLTSDGILEENYYDITKERILNRGIRGNIRE